MAHQTIGLVIEQVRTQGRDQIANYSMYHKQVEALRLFLSSAVFLLGNRGIYFTAQNGELIHMQDVSRRPTRVKSRMYWRTSVK